MKKILLAGALAITAVFSSSAENYSTIELSYDNTQISANKPKMLGGFGIDKGKSFSLNGVGLQYNYGIGVSRLPMNVEIGLKLSAGFNGKTLITNGGIRENKYNTQLIRLAIPVSYIYHIPVKDSFSIAPYVGLDFRFNLIANTKYSSKFLVPDGEGGYDIEEEDDEDVDTGGSWFDKTKHGFTTANRFQMGWHIGARFEFSKVFIGIEYGTDFIPFLSYTTKDGNKDKKNTFNTGNLAVGIGYKF